MLLRRVFSYGLTSNIWDGVVNPVPQRGYETKPSARLGKLLHVPHYRKILHGTKAIQAIGIDKLLAECLHFSGRYSRLIELKN